MPNYKEKICKICGKTFIPKSPNQTACRNKECIAEVRRTADRKRYSKNKKSYSKKKCK